MGLGKRFCDRQVRLLEGASITFMDGVCAREGPVELVDVDADGNIVATIESGTAGDDPFSNPARNADCCLAYTGTEESDPGLYEAC